MHYPSISANGRYVAFHSWANNLVNNDANGTWDIFVNDRLTGQTTLVSIASDGTQGNDESMYASISADGRYVAFHAEASNLVEGDTNSTYDVFVHDRQTGQTHRVSIASDGTQGNDLSGVPSISDDGRYVVFESRADNLVSDDANNAFDVFVHDQLTDETSRVSVASDGMEGNYGSGSPSISAEGRYVVFSSAASNLVSGDTNNVGDIFVHDRQTGQTSRVSIASDGSQGNGASYMASISTDGRYVAFSSVASNLVGDDTNGVADIFVHDRQTGETSRVSISTNGTQGNGQSYMTSISTDGRFVAFVSLASNLVNGDTNNRRDVFVHDRLTGETSRVSIAPDGTQGNDNSIWPSISANGRYVAFDSDASNLVSDDTNGYTDVFVHDRGE
jgi:Tol biopolymer transport system component